MAYAVATMPDGRIKMSDGTIQEAPNSFSSGAPVSNITPVIPGAFQLPQATGGFKAPNMKSSAGTPVGPDLSQIPYSPVQDAPQDQSMGSPQGGETPEIIHQITSDILAGMKPTAIEKNYPEMKGQDLTIFAQLASDIADGMPANQAPRLYPEIFSQEAIEWGKTQPVINRGDMVPSQESGAIFQDQHPTEGIVEQAKNALGRAPMHTIEGIKSGFTQVADAMSEMTNVGSNMISHITGTPEYYAGGQDLVKPITKFGAGASTVAFNTFKAPLATGLNLANELPGIQYIMQGISKAIEGTGKGMAELTGVDPETMQNIITIGMNTLGLKTKGGTVETVQKAGEAYKSAPTVPGGIYEAGKSVAGDVLKSTKDVAMMPFDVVKGVGKYAIDKSGIKSPLSQNYVEATTEAGTRFTIEQTPGVVKNITDKAFEKTNELLAQQSVFPKATKEKTTKGRLNSDAIALDGIKQIYEDRAKGLIESDIHTMGGGVDGLIEALDYHGKRIGEISKSDAVVDIKEPLVTMEQASEGAKFTRTNASIQGIIKDTISDFKDLGMKPTIADIQAGLSSVKNRIFKDRSNIADLAKTEEGRALNDYLKKVEDSLNSTIENHSGKSAEFKIEKAAYSKLIKIIKDLPDSYMVELRSQGKGVTGTAGKIAGIVQVLSDPSMSGVFKALILKQAGETMQYYKSRGGNWETLIRNLDREAVQRSSTPNSPRNDSNTRNTSGNMDTTKPLALPSPSGKLLSARTVNVKPIIMSKKLSTGISENAKIRDPRVQARNDYLELKSLEESLSKGDEMIKSKSRLEYNRKLEQIKVDFANRKTERIGQSDYEKIYKAEMKIIRENRSESQYGNPLVRAFNDLKRLNEKHSKGGVDLIEYNSGKSVIRKRFVDAGNDYIHRMSEGMPSNKTVEELFDEMNSKGGKHSVYNPRAIKPTPSVPKESTPIVKPAPKSIVKEGKLFVPKEKGFVYADAKQAKGALDQANVNLEKLQEHIKRFPNSPEKKNIKYLQGLVENAKKEFDFYSKTPLKNESKIIKPVKTAKDKLLESRKNK